MIGVGVGDEEGGVRRRRTCGGWCFQTTKPTRLVRVSLSLAFGSSLTLALTPTQTQTLTLALTLSPNPNLDPKLDPNPGEREDARATTHQP